MKLSRRSRLTTALFALVSVLFMQLAVAAYACPSMQIGYASESSVTQAQAADHQNMAGCEGVVDTEQPQLCHAHAQVGNQSLDKPASPDVSPSVAILLVPAINDIDLAYRPIAARADTAWLMRTFAPPLSIQNCCFRI
jgi:hypothetical protein